MSLSYVAMRKKVQQWCDNPPWETQALVEVATCEIIAYAHVEAAGTVTTSCGTITVERFALGRYAVTAPGADIIKVDVIEDFAARDSVTARLEGPLGPIHISEGDNGAAANTLRDRGFVVTAYGPGTKLTLL